ncbi:MerC domain-containing protein [Mucilaginibacter antarcticus]|uniref:MerC domain-containing protein n=1 Tax=Mucilaginibacter antarcticus TaxID=1855725 RepID=A0ABW5XS21_9SPHI
MVSKKLGSRLDRIGMTASTICALHCAFVPILLTFLPLAGVGFLAHPLFEVAMIIIALLLGVSSIFLSYFRTHRRALPMLLLLIGFAMVVLGHLYLGGWIEMVIVPLGGLTIAFAHFVNFKYVGVCNNNDHFFHLKHNHPKRHL